MSIILAGVVLLCISSTMASWDALRHSRDGTEDLAAGLALFLSIVATIGATVVFASSWGK